MVAEFVVALIEGVVEVSVAAQGPSTRLVWAVLLGGVVGLGIGFIIAARRKR